MDEAQLEKIIQKRLALLDHAKYQRFFANALKASQKAGAPRGGE